MSGGSSSSGSSSVRSKSGRVKGVPKMCWCGERTMPLCSKSEHNLYQRYFRCAHAASQKLVNDTHVFKWMDEALLNEIETLQMKTGMLEHELKVLKTETLSMEKMMFEKVKLQLAKELDGALAEAKWDMKKMVSVCFGCVVIVGFLSIIRLIMKV